MCDRAAEKLLAVLSDAPHTKAKTLLTHYLTILRAGETIPLQIDGLTNFLTDSRQSVKTDGSVIGRR